MARTKSAACAISVVEVGVIVLMARRPSCEANGVRGETKLRGVHGEGPEAVEVEDLAEPDGEDRGLLGDAH